MNKKKYLPVWTDGLSYDEQHLTYWIADNMERVNQDYSLLPLRLKGGYYCDRKRFDNFIDTIDNYFERGKCRIKSKIVPLAYYVAEKAFDAAAEEFFKKYPEAFNITFSKLNYNGVYDTQFDIDYATRLNLFKTILDTKIDEYCIVDELFEYKKNEAESYIQLPEYCITALMDIKEEDICALPDILSSYGFPYSPKKQVNVKKEDIYEYYFTIPEKIFYLGNQYIKYRQNSQENAAFFKAAENRDLSVIEKHVRNGVDINTIDSDGRTAFAKYIGSAFDVDKEMSDNDDLRLMLSWGANPAIYGAGFDSEPLADVCLDDNAELVTLLLEFGVSPHSYPCIDEPYEWAAETLLERTERWAEGDLSIDLEPGETQQIILNILKKYA